MNKKIKKIYEWSKRYISLTLFAVIAFVLFILFFNENSIMKSIEYNERIVELKAEIKQNRDTLEYYNNLNNRLNTDKETMERIVREQYHMQRPNEDVYIFE